MCEDASSVTLSSALLASAIEHVKCVCEVVFDHTKEHQEIELSESNCNMNQNSEQKLSVITNRKGLFDMTHPEENASMLCLLKDDISFDIISFSS